VAPPFGRRPRRSGGFRSSVFSQNSQL